MKRTRYAIFGDIHSNLEAFTVVLDDAKQNETDCYVCVGDIVGYNANPAECLSKVLDLECIMVRGNHDHYCSHDECLEDFHPLAANVIDWTRRQLTRDQVAFLKNLKLSMRVDGFTIVHSTLDMPEKWGYVFDTLEADANFNYQATSVCFHGHTHVPTVFEKMGRVARNDSKKLKIALGRKYFVNVGSVGQPRDGDPRASYVLYDMEKKEIEFRRIAYDVKATQEKIRKVGLPERLAKRLEIGK